MKKLIRTMIFIVICIIIVLFSIFSPLLFGKNNDRNKMQFSSELWQENENERIYMYNDLIQKYDLKSMTKDEIIAILGKSTAVDSGNSLTYTLGRQINSWFTSYLYIKYDDYNNVTDVSVYTD